MLSQKLKQLRQSKGMTLQQGADQLAGTRASVSKWESAKSQPDMSRIQAIAELFGVSSHYLLGLSTSPTLKDYPVIELKFGVSLDFLIDYYSDLERYPSNLPVVDTAFFVRLNDETLSDLGPPQRGDALHAPEHRGWRKYVYICKSKIRNKKQSGN